MIFFIFALLILTSFECNNYSNHNTGNVTCDTFYRNDVKSLTDSLGDELIAIKPETTTVEKLYSLLLPDTGVNFRNDRHYPRRKSECRKVWVCGRIREITISKLDLDSNKDGDLEFQLYGLVHKDEYINVEMPSTLCSNLNNHSSQELFKRLKNKIKKHFNFKDDVGSIKVDTDTFVTIEGFIFVDIDYLGKESSRGITPVEIHPLTNISFKKE